MFGLVFVACAAAGCGGRAELPGRTERAMDDPGRDAAATPEGGPSEASAHAVDAGRSESGLVDSGAEEGGVAVESGAEAAPLPVEADCRCPDEEFHIDAEIDGFGVRFTHPYPLRLYCEETTVHLGNGGCDDVQRLSGCAGPDAAPPCIYAAIDPGDRPYIGHLLLEPGTTLELIAGSMEVEPSSDRVATGSFEASYQRRDGAEVVSVVGEFRACRPLLGPADCGG